MLSYVASSAARMSSPTGMTHDCTHIPCAEALDKYGLAAV